MGFRLQVRLAEPDLQAEIDWLHYNDGRPAAVEHGMSFLLNCPNCGPRDVSEFRYGGQVLPGPECGGNLPGPQQERWYHRLGCRRWLLAERDVRTNEVLQVRWLDGGAS